MRIVAVNALRRARRNSLFYDWRCCCGIHSAVRIAHIRMSVAEEEDTPFDQDFRNGQGAPHRTYQVQLRTGCWTHRPLPVEASGAGADPGLEILIARGGPVAIALLLCDGAQS
jgi:hypothetical protein